jgi:hypothetical protein
MPANNNLKNHGWRNLLCLSHKRSGRQDQQDEGGDTKGMFHRGAPDAKKTTRVSWKTSSITPMMSVQTKVILRDKLFAVKL